MNNKKRIIILTLLFLAIGFATVSTTLYLNGVIGINTNQDDFDIYYSNTIINDKKDTSIIIDDKNIEFNTSFKSIGDAYKIEYDITNGSKNYDADVEINCTDGNDYVTVVNNWTNKTRIDATETKTGILNIEMIKGYTGEELDLSVKCTITANAVERTSLSDGTPASKANIIYNYSGILADKNDIPVSGGTLAILSTPHIVAVDENGKFEVDNVEEGTHHMYYFKYLTVEEVENLNLENMDEEEIEAAATLTATASFSGSIKGLEFTNGYKIIDSYEKQILPGVNLYEFIKSNAKTDTIDFNVNSDKSGTNGIYTTTETESGNPVYYYRGNVNNSIIFNNMCWKIIRTTETGGVKLFYNGPVTHNGDCDSTIKAFNSINYKAFNTYDTDNEYVGYMYGNDNVHYTETKSSEISDLWLPSVTTYQYRYSKTYELDEKRGYYRLTGDIVTSNDHNYAGYYTCKSSTYCNTLYYIDSYKDDTYANAYVYSTIYYGSTSYEDAHTNKYDSNIKSIVDNWYKTNFTSSDVTSKIEDTVYCNDRSIATPGDNNELFKNELSTVTTLGYGNNKTTYSGATRVSYYTKNLKPSLICSQKNDKFTVSSEIGNGDLTYPVGLITADEVVLAGFNSYYSTDYSSTGTDSSIYLNQNTYFGTSGDFWTMTPIYENFTDENRSFAFNVGIYGGDLHSWMVDTPLNVNPVISLVSGVLIKNAGDGSETNPYVVKNDDDIEYYEPKVDDTLYENIKSNAEDTTFSFYSNSSYYTSNGIYKTSETDSGREVYYYRGKVDNNMIFNNMCWKIIRTTETEGIKLLYNGLPINGECNSTGNDTIIGEGSYNTLTNDNTYIGYMYGVNTYYIDNGRNTESISKKMTHTIYNYDEDDNLTKETSLVNNYGTSYTFDTISGTYTLTGNVTSGEWNEKYVGYYACLSVDSSSCSTLYYISGYDSETNAVVYKYSSTFIQSTSYDEAHTNTYDSSVKKIIDKWYSTNFTDSTITSMIEDTVYCNDRSIGTGGNNNSQSSAQFSNYGYGTYNTAYGAISRSTYFTTSPTPSLKCTNSNDRFTVSKINGNGALTYPVGMITSDEVIYAGYNTYTSSSSNYQDTNSYITSNASFWTMTPIMTSNISVVYAGGMLIPGGISYNYGIRPVISIKGSVNYSGDGTTSNPYKIKG